MKLEDIAIYQARENPYDFKGKYVQGKGHSQRKQKILCFRIITQKVLVIKNRRQQNGICCHVTKN